MANEELLCTVALNSWKLTVGRFSQTLAAFTDEQLQKQVAPGRNRLFYLLGHLTAVHDRLFTMFDLGERLYPELDEHYISNPDKALPDPVSAADLRNSWTEVNARLIAAFDRFSSQDWLKKHAAVSEEDFAKDPARNRFAVLQSRTNHLSFHLGQVILAKEK
ncbi:DinB family protein [Paracidobacterium acidisoli]|uniref:DinB family protein n=1 Tax=Paracidobacterium acidisoli TaxID=2303751 RepID=A0A372IP77_9BACT|nr:DinB family protein [Paracidobacterium acidisoli]MBT9330970.1 DinB family protein [Paracidobacterium acidisoli]